MPVQIERCLSSRNIMLLYPAQMTSDLITASAVRAGVPLRVR